MEETVMDFTVTNLQTIMTAFTDVVSISTLIPMLAAIITVGAGFTFMWFGIRKALSTTIGTGKGGKLRV